MATQYAFLKFGERGLARGTFRDPGEKGFGTVGIFDVG
jgi:hypothetical protein